MKKTLQLVGTFSAIFTALLLSLMLKAQDNESWSGKKADQWYNTYEWLNGLKMKPHNSLNRQEFAKQYHAHKDWWDKAFAFMKDNDLASLKPGHYDIVDKYVYADVTETESTVFEKSKWHSHRKFSDIQYIMRGKDSVGVAPVSSGIISVPFNDTKGDAQFYSDATKKKYYIADQSSFFIFFPTDIHRPFIRMKGYDTVKRIRFKVAVDQ